MATLEDLSSDARDELALLARELADSPETRNQFLRLAKQKRPNIPIPEIDLDDRVQKYSERSAQRVQELENKLAERDAMEELNRRRRSLMSKHKLDNEDQVAEVEKIMLEKGITNHETAADYWKWMNESAAPTPSGYAPNVMDKTARDVLAKYWKNPAMAARDEAAKALNELRKNPKPVGY
jgi:hypothetical protein